MPRTQLHRPVATFLSILALLAGTFGPAAAPAQAAPPGQGDTEPAAGIVVSIDEPTHRSATTARRVLVRGWAADPASQRGPGVTRVDLYLDGGPDQGGLYLGQASYGRERPDVAMALGGQRFLNSGFELVIDMPRGPHTIVAVAAPSGGAPALIVPGVASVHATVGGPSGRSAHGCGAGGYCSTDEGGEAQGARIGWNREALYQGNLYVGSGAYGHGPTAPPYGWWDEYNDEMAAYILAYRTYAYPYPQSFYGHVPRLYDQSLLSTLATQGVLAFPGGACVGPAYAGLETLGLSVLGGYSVGFPYLHGIGTTGNGTGTIGFPSSTFGAGAPFGSPLSVPLSGSVGMGSIFARGQSGAWNGALTSLARITGGRAAGPGGAGGALSSGGGAQPGQPVGANLFGSGCNQRF
jgi:hypothetical protein